MRKVLCLHAIASLLLLMAFQAGAVTVHKGADCIGVGDIENLPQNVETRSVTSIIARYLDSLAFQPSQLGNLGYFLPSPVLSKIRTEQSPPGSWGKSDANQTSALQVGCTSETRADFLLNSWATTDHPTGLLGGPQISYRHVFANNVEAPHIMLASETSSGKSLRLRGLATLLQGSVWGQGKCEMNLQMELKRTTDGAYVAVQFNFATVGSNPLQYAIADNDGQNPFFSSPAKRLGSAATGWWSDAYYTVHSGTQFQFASGGAFPETEFSIGMSRVQLENILGSIPGIGNSVDNWWVYGVNMYVEALGPKSGTREGVDESSCAGSFRGLRFETIP